MNDMSRRFMKVGVTLPRILVPAESIDRRSWAVVACDQFSSEREYWEKVARTVGDKPSTLNLIFPECYLEDNDKNERIAAIRASMKNYLEKGYFTELPEGFMLVERHTPYEKKPRVGLMIAVDLEQYRYGKDSKSLIRPTEGTIVERLPPRMEIRRGAALELPHIMLLVDDPEKSVIEPLYASRQYLPKVYDFDLMENSGHLRGWHVSDPRNLEKILSALEKLADPSAYKAKYRQDEVLLFAVGDGNHSLATAKAIWEETKKNLQEGLAEHPENAQLLENHPARFALVELVNIYDEGLPFHPIHRVLFKVNEAELLGAMEKAGAVVRRTASHEQAFKLADAPQEGKTQTIAFVSATDSGVLVFEQPRAKLAAGTIQEILDAYLKAHPETGIDYIHGECSLVTLAQKQGNFGLYLPPVDKKSFFGTVIADGVMPRKTFSMGEAPEKRFYMEARKIQP